MSLACIVRRACLALILLLPALPLAAAEPAHDHSAHGTDRLELDHGRKWATDAPLREGMTTMRAALAAQLPAIHHDTLDAVGYERLAGTLGEAMQGIFAQCRLGPAADIQLHNLLVPMHAQIQTMGSAAALAERRAAAIAVMGALGEYGRFFEHPGWEPLGH